MENCFDLLFESEDLEHILRFGMDNKDHFKYKTKVPNSKEIKEDKERRKNKNGIQQLPFLQKRNNKKA